jgi:hypothetical protein
MARTYDAESTSMGEDAVPPEPIDHLEESVLIIQRGVSVSDEDPVSPTSSSASQGTPSGETGAMAKKQDVESGGNGVPLGPYSEILPSKVS